MANTIVLTDRDNELPRILGNPNEDLHPADEIKSATLEPYEPSWKSDRNELRDSHAWSPICMICTRCNLTFHAFVQRPLSCDDALQLLPTQD